MLCYLLNVTLTHNLQWCHRLITDSTKVLGQILDVRPGANEATFSEGNIKANFKKDWKRGLILIFIDLVNCSDTIQWWCDTLPIICNQYVLLLCHHCSQNACINGFSSKEVEEVNVNAVGFELWETVLVKWMFRNMDNRSTSESGKFKCLLSICMYIDWQCKVRLWIVTWQYFRSLRQRVWIY